MKKILYILLGILSFIVSIIGTILPVMPTVPFLLFSMFCFSRGSERFSNKIKQTKLFNGNIMQNIRVLIKDKMNKAKRHK